MELKLKGACFEQWLARIETTSWVHGCHLLIYNLGLLFLAATESTFPIQRTTNVKLVLFKGELNDRQSQLDFTAHQEITGDKKIHLNLASTSMHQELGMI